MGQKNDKENNGIQVLIKEFMMMPFPLFLKRHVPTGHCNDALPFDWQCFFTRILIIAAKRLYGKASKGAWTRVNNVMDYDESIDFIEKNLRAGNPFMAGKIGTGDMETIQRYIDIHASGSCFVKWCRLLGGKIGPFWFDNWIRSAICICAGVFPQTDESIEEFCRTFMGYCDGFDALPQYTEGEKRIYEKLCPDARVIKLDALSPIGVHTWYGALAGKRVLVVHPYVKTIRAQYEKGIEYHKGQGPLPRFNLIQYRPVNSIGGKSDQFSRWKEALDFMIADIEKIDFDVALLGCGVYGVPLSVHIKRMGRQAIYTGGATQIIFGIKGKRWDNLGIYNEHWVRPFPEDVPQNMNLIEGGTFL